MISWKQRNSEGLVHVIDL